MNALAPWLGVSKARFLALPLTLVAAGAAAAAWDGRFGWGPTLLATLALLLLHAAVNALNEASDMVTGIDLHTVPTPFSGGSGTLPSGRLSVRATRVFGYGTALAGGLIGVYFALRLERSFLLLMAAGAVAVLFYTDVFARGFLGELFAGIGLGALPVWGAAWVQGQRPGTAALWAGVPAFFMTFDLLLLNEFPDEQADRSGGRRNLVLLLGRRRAALVYAVAALSAPLALVVAVALGALPWLALVALVPSLLLAKPLAWAFRNAEQPVPWPALGANAQWNLATNTTLALALAAALALPGRASAGDAAASSGGFVPIWNGRDLAGWHVSEVNHHGNSKGWRVENGVLVATQDRPGNGGILLTDRRYRDFEVSLEIDPDWGCDGGLFLRSNEKGEAYQVMIDYLEGGSVGGIYGEGLTGVETRAPAGWQRHWKKGEWNRLRARIEGETPRIRVWLNEALLVDWTDTRNHAAGGARDGMIALQVHFSNGSTPRWKPGGIHRFRNIAVKEL